MNLLLLLLLLEGEPSVGPPAPQPSPPPPPPAPQPSPPPPPFFFKAGGIKTPLDRLYGSGFAYPLRFDAGTGGPAVASGVDSVRASLTRLFETAPGSEFMLAAYGSPLLALVFEQDTNEFRLQVEAVIRESVRQWEPRIAEVLFVDVTREQGRPGMLRVETGFLLLDEQVEGNFVFMLQTEEPG